MKTKLQDLGLILAMSSTLLSVLFLLHNLDMREQLKIANDQKLRYSGMLARCMNGGTLFDSLSNTAFFCDRVIAVRNP